MLTRFLSHTSVPCVIEERIKKENFESEKFFNIKNKRKTGNI